MPYSSAQLTSFFTTLSGGAQPDAATTSAINTAASQDAAGTTTDLQAFAVVANSAQVRATTDVAVSTYAFFTGATPSQAGVNYLVNNPGTGYNTSYYNGVNGTATAPGAGGFDTENRYFNAALNLAGNPGAVGNAAFAQTYGSLTIPQAIAAEYQAIVGTASVGATAAQAAINAITNALPFFQAVASQRVAAGGNVDIATKAIIAGYILEEAIKADVGVYAKALDGFNAAVATGAATFNTNLLSTYGAGGTNFDPTTQPLLNGQTLTNTTGTATSVGVAANGVATLNIGGNATINFTGDIAVNNGQLSVVESTTGGSLNLNFNGQITSTTPSLIATGVGVATVTAQSAVGGTTLSLDLYDPNLTTLNIRGNESVAYAAPLYAFTDGTFSLGALTTINASGATAPVVIDVSAPMTNMANNTASGGVTVTGTTGADTFVVRNFARVTTGGGNDTVMVAQPASVSSLSVITDDHAGIVLGFMGQPAAKFNATAITATSVQNGLDQAAALGPGTVSYFQSGGDTYVVADASAATTFQPGADFAVRLIGAHNLSTSTLTAQGAVTLGG